METKQAVDPQTQDAELRRRPRRSELLIARALETRLKAERVQEMLKRMPGWNLAPGGRAIDRVREFPTPEIASAYAGWVLGAASRMGRCMAIRLAPGPRLIISLEGTHGRYRDLTEVDFNFAKTLG